MSAESDVYNGIASAFARTAARSDVEPGQCQRAMGATGQLMLNEAGLTKEAAAYWNDYSFGTATVAWQASAAAGAIVSMDPDDIQPFDSVYCEYTSGGVNYGHVFMGLGPNRAVSMTANRTGLVQDLGHGAFISDVRAYTAQPGRKLRGISRRNGNRPALATLLRPQPKPNQRVVVPKGGRRRADRFDPNSEYLSVANFGGGTIQTPTGWAHGAEVSGSTVWFLFADGRATHSSAFTDPSTHDIPDLNPVVPVIHTVSFDLGDTGFNVDVEDGKPVPEPDRLMREGYTFDGWYFGTTRWNFDAPILADITLEPHFTEIVPEIPDEPDEPAGPGEPDVDEPEDQPEKPPTGQIPIVIPNIENLDDAAVILADSVSPWLSSGVRAKVYEWAQVAGAASGSISTAAGGVLLVVGVDSEAGRIAASVAAISGSIAGAALLFAARLARKNTPLEAAKRLAFKGEPLGVATVAKIRANNQ